MQVSPTRLLRQLLLNVDVDRKRIVSHTAPFPSVRTKSVAKRECDLVKAGAQSSGRAIDIDRFGRIEIIAGGMNLHDSKCHAIDFRLDCKRRLGVYMNPFHGHESDSELVGLTFLHLKFGRVDFQPDVFPCTDSEYRKRARRKRRAQGKNRQVLKLSMIAGLVVLLVGYSIYVIL